MGREKEALDALMSVTCRQWLRFTLGGWQMGYPVTRPLKQHRRDCDAEKSHSTLLPLVGRINASIKESHVHHCQRAKRVGLSEVSMFVFSIQGCTDHLKSNHKKEPGHPQ